jgi:hypothetical protein
VRHTFRTYGILALVLSAGILALYARRRRPADAVSLAGPRTECLADLAAQAAYLDRESYFRDHVFARYPASTDPTLHPAPIDINSSPLTRAFKSRLREAVDSHGVNFAGHYSLVGVGMTGWGMNYWIVDRITGRAREFPFHASFLDFDVHSTLIIMNARDSIRSLLNENRVGGCFFLNQEKVSDLRPFYFQWRNDTLSLLAPEGHAPPVNSFWLDYLSDIPEGTPSPVARFVRETRKGVIRTLNQVPPEGYTGFMLIEAFRGIEPADFTGVSTRNGDYGVLEGRLQFTGNASLDAPAMTTEGMALLLRNIARRLSLPISTDAEVVALLEQIA